MATSASQLLSYSNGQLATAIVDALPQLRLEGVYVKTLFVNGCDRKTRDEILTPLRTVWPNDMVGVVLRRFLYGANDLEHVNHDVLGVRLTMQFYYHNLPLPWPSDSKLTWTRLFNTGDKIPCADLVKAFDALFDTCGFPYEDVRTIARRTRLYIRAREQNYTVPNKWAENPLLNTIDSLVLSFTQIR